MNFRFALFQTSLQKMFKDSHAQSLSLLRIRENINKEYPSHQFSEDEIKAALNEMAENNQVMVAEEIVFLI